MLRTLEFNLAELDGSSPFVAELEGLFSRDGIRRGEKAFFGLHAVTTPLSMVNRLTGTEAWTDPISLPAGSTVNSQFVGANPPVSFTGTGTLTVTQALHAGKVVVLSNLAACTVNLPAPTGTGAVYTFFTGITITSNSITIDAKANDASAVISGIAVCGGTTPKTFSSATNTNELLLNGTTTGGVLGDLIEFIDISLHQWAVNAQLNASGTAATPFTNH